MKLAKPKISDAKKLIPCCRAIRFTLQAWSFEQLETQITVKFVKKSSGLSSGLAASAVTSTMGLRSCARSKDADARWEIYVKIRVD